MELIELLRQGITKAIDTGTDKHLFFKSIAINNVLKFVLKDKIIMLEVLLEAHKREDFSVRLQESLDEVRKELLTLK